MGTLRQPAHHRIRIADEADAGVVRRTAAGIADGYGAAPAAKGRAELVATELATNLVRHAKPGGWVLVRPVPPAGIEFLAVDHGPGIADPAAALEGRTPAPGGLGRGLAAVRRASTRFDVHTEPGRGTTVLSRIELADPGATGPRERSERQHYGQCWGGVSVGVSEVCGDGWAVAEVPHGLAVAVVDGLGHGEKASLAAEAALDAFAVDPADLDGLAVRANEAMRDTRGAAMTVCLLDREREELRYFAVGNVSGLVATGADRRRLVFSPGTLGLRLAPPRIRLQRHPWPAGSCLVLWTDGLDSHVTGPAGTVLRDHDPAVVAAALHREHARERDDATAVVVYG